METIEKISKASSSIFGITGALFAIARPVLVVGSGVSVASPWTVFLIGWNGSWVLNITVIVLGFPIKVFITRGGSLFIRGGGGGGCRSRGCSRGCGGVSGGGVYVFFWFSCSIKW